MYEKLFLASSLAIILIGSSNQSDAILATIPISQKKSELNENEICKVVAGGHVFLPFNPLGFTGKK